MIKVTVRFTCVPDPVARRRAYALGMAMVGKAKASIYDGYIIKLSRRGEKVTALVVDMPVALRGVPGGAYRLGFNAGWLSTAFGDRHTLDTREGWRASFLEPVTPKVARFPAWSGRFYTTATSGGIFVTINVPYIVPPLPDVTSWSVTAVHATFFQGRPAADEIYLEGSGAAREGTTWRAFIGWRSADGPMRAVVFTPELLHDVVPVQEDVGLPNLSVIYNSVNRPEYVEAPVTPTGFGYDRYRPRWNYALPPHLCFTAMAEVVDDVPLSPVVFCTTYAHVPLHPYALFDEGAPDYPILWYIADTWARAAARPGLLLGKVVREINPGDLDPFPPDGSVIGLCSFSGNPVPDVSAPDIPRISDTAVIDTADFPPFFRQASKKPGFPVGQWVSELRLPCIPGAIACTAIGEDLEFLVSMRACDRYEEPITREYRELGDIEPGETANVVINKTGFMVVSVNASTLSYSVEVRYPDVLGPETCPDYNSATMAADVAKLPTVIWGGVIEGERCYVVGVSRYERTAFLGAARQDVDRNGDFTDSYRGWTSDDWESDIAVPAYGTDLGFGPYPDAQPAELWFLRGNSRTVVPLSGTTRVWGTQFNYFPSPPNTDGRDWYFFASLAHMGIQADPDEQPDVAAYNDRMSSIAHEWLPAYDVVQQVAYVGYGRVVYFVYQAPFDGTFSVTLGIRVFDFTTMTDSALSTFSQAVDDIGVRCAITCYQREVRDADDQVVCPFGLLLTTTVDDEGDTWVSNDGGESWAKLIDGSVGVPGQATTFGAPGMGQFYVGNQLAPPAPWYPFMKEGVDG